MAIKISFGMVAGGGTSEAGLPPPSLEPPTSGIHAFWHECLRVSQERQTHGLTPYELRPWFSHDRRALHAALPL
ncbi:MAG: hypothetical protein QXT02_05825 [Candidatus Hadarchaeum sp.]|uniref:hypothetical protein n=1 Tax=Candidatus Hadarchaeum sp. TaxID=2883567 RepID=UPI003173C63E